MTYPAYKAFDGIIGNRADAALTWFWPHLGPATAWGSMDLVVIALLLVCLAAMKFHTERRLKGKLHVALGLLGLQGTVLRLVEQRATTKGKDATLTRMLEATLADCTRIFGPDVSRGSVLMPNHKGQYLVPVATYQMPADSRKRNRFYIGKDVAKLRGTAGAVFLKNELRIVTIVRKDGQWSGQDGSGYVRYSDERPHLPYRSFAAVPIRDRQGEPIGVLCLDSSATTTFNAPGIEAILHTIANCMALEIGIDRGLVGSWNEGSPE